jgi:hypothetical protein
MQTAAVSESDVQYPDSRDLKTPGWRVMTWEVV